MTIELVSTSKTLRIPPDIDTRCIKSAKKLFNKITLFANFLFRRFIIQNFKNTLQYHTRYKYDTLYYVGSNRLLRS